MTITPTKPLTPSHVKAALWCDVLYKATRPLADVGYLWSHRMANLAGQTLGFWHYLDRTVGDIDFGRCSAVEIGEWYTRFHTERPAPPFAELRPYVDAVERSGWVHQSSARIWELWRRGFELLGVFDPSLAAPLAGLAPDEALTLLCERNQCVDTRPTGGSAFLDGTAHGMPLRLLVTADGQATYLLWALCDLLPAVADFDNAVLVADRELTDDYALLQRVLTDFGGRASRLMIGRVPIEGAVGPARKGGWQDYTLDIIAESSLEEFEIPEFRLGMRLYFIGVLAAASPQSLRLDILRRCLRRAQRILDAAGDSVSGDEYTAFLQSMRRDDGYVDPYRLTVSMFEREQPAALRNLLDTVYLR